MEAEAVNRLNDRPMRIRMSERSPKPWVGISQLISPRCEAIAVFAEERLKRPAPYAQEVPLVLGKLKKLEHEPRAAEGIQFGLHQLEDCPFNTYVVAVGHRVVVRIRTEVQPLVREPSRSEGQIMSITPCVEAFRTQVAAAR